MNGFAITSAIAFLCFAGLSGSVLAKTQNAAKHDAVFVDGSYFGKAGQVNAVPLAPGMHHVVLYGIDGTAAYQQDVKVASGSTTDVNPYQNG